MNETTPPAGGGRGRGGAIVFVVFFSIIALALLGGYWYQIKSPANIWYLNTATHCAAWVAEQFGDSAAVRIRVDPFDSIAAGNIEDEPWPSCHYVFRPGQATTLIVAPECGAIEVMAIFLAAVIAFPASFLKKLIGAVIGLPVLYGVNVIRVACLFVVGALDTDGKLLDFAHHYVWQTVYIVFVVLLWLAWVRYVVERKAS